VKKRRNNNNCTSQLSILNPPNQLLKTKKYRVLLYKLFITFSQHGLEVTYLFFLKYWLVVARPARKTILSMNHEQDSRFQVAIADRWRNKFGFKFAQTCLRQYRQSNNQKKSIAKSIKQAITATHDEHQMNSLGMRP
jgi:hypothetical protein